MADGVVDPPSNNLGLTAGDSGGSTTSSTSKKKKAYIYGGIGLVGLVVIYLYAKSKSSATASSTTTAPSELITPASNQDTVAGGIGSTLSTENMANTASITNALSQAISSLEAQIAGNQSAVLAAVGSAGSGGTPSSAPSTGSTLVQQQQAQLLNSFLNGGYNQGIAEIPGQGEYIEAEGPLAQVNESDLPTGTQTYVELQPNVFTPLTAALFATVPGAPQYVLQNQPNGGYQQG